MAEDEMAGWHHRLNRWEFAHSLGNGEGHGSLVRCSPYGHKALNKRLDSNSTITLIIFTIKRFVSPSGWCRVICAKHQL